MSAADNKPVADSNLEEQSGAPCGSSPLDKDLYKKGTQNVLCIPKEKQRTEIGYEVNFAVMPDSFTYTLIYVDEDYIPELVVDRGSCAGR